MDVNPNHGTEDMAKVVSVDTAGKGVREQAWGLVVQSS